MSSHYTLMLGIRNIDAGIDDIIIVIFNLKSNINIDKKTMAKSNLFIFYAWTIQIIIIFCHLMVLIGFLLFLCNCFSFSFKDKNDQHIMLVIVYRTFIFIDTFSVLHVIS